MAAPLKLIVNREAPRLAVPVLRDIRWFKDAAHVAQALSPERPVLCFSPEALALRAAAFLGGFPGEVSYAVKANSHETVIARLAASRLEVFDVASIEEM